MREPTDEMIAAGLDAFRDNAPLLATNPGYFVAAIYVAMQKAEMEGAFIPEEDREPNYPDDYA